MRIKPFLIAIASLLSAIALVGCSPQHPDIIDISFSSGEQPPEKYQYFDHHIDRVIVGTLVSAVQDDRFIEGIGVVTFSDGTQVVMSHIPFTMNDLYEFAGKPFTYLLQMAIGYGDNPTIYHVRAIKSPIW
jgi:hypothetical protein